MRSERPQREPNPFWRYSLALYRRAGVEAALLALQQRCGTDTNLLLYACWLASRGQALDQRRWRQAMAAVAPWQAEAIQPLRRARHALEAAAPGLPPGWGAELRQRLARVELDLEYLEQHTLFTLAQQLRPPRRALAPRAAARASLGRYFGLLGLDAALLDGAELRCLLDAALAYKPR